MQTNSMEDLVIGAGINHGKAWTLTGERGIDANERGSGL